MMMKTSVKICILFLIGLMAGTRSFAQTLASQLEAKLHASVAIIALSAEHPEVGGTAFVVGEKLLMTAAHVVEDIQDGAILMTIDGITHTVQVSDIMPHPEEADIAIITLTGDNADLFEYIPLKIAKYNVAQDAEVSTYGGIVNTGFYQGFLISATGDIMQTSEISCQPGKSGSPLIDNAGNVVGLLSSYAPDHGTDEPSETCFWVSTKLYTNFLESFAGISFVESLPEHTVGDYRSAASGHWNVPATWERYDGDDFVAATVSPDATDGIIKIQSTHEVNITSAVTANQLEVETGGVLTLSNTLTIVHYASNDFIVNGTLDFDEGTLDGDGIVKVNGVMNWQEGNLEVNSEWGSAAVVNKSTSGEATIASMITNKGTFNWSGGGIGFSGGSLINKITGAIKASGSNQLTNIDGVNDFTNEGTFLKITSAGPSTIAVPFTNKGIINGAGELEITGSYVNDGTIELAAESGTLEVNGVQPLSASSTLAVQMAEGNSGSTVFARNTSLTLAGALVVALAEPTDPIATGTYTIIELSSGTITGTFSSVTLPEGFSVKINSTTVELVKREILPGSGKAISFDGVDDVIEVDNGFALQNFTVEMWVKPGATQVPFATIIDNNHSDLQNWVCQQNGSNTNEYSFGCSTGSAGVTAAFTLKSNQWQHLALVKAADALKVYVNGILIQSTPWTGSLNYSSPFLRMGNYAGGSRNWKGVMDEVRFYNVAVPEEDIRDRMCRKISIFDYLHPNVVGYYKFDETNGTVAFDNSASANDATLINTPVRQTSGAPIGNVSLHSYAGPSSSSRINSSGHPQQILATLTAGEADGIQVYAISELPNSLSGITLFSSEKDYYGVFPINGTNPEYSITYQYSTSQLTDHSASELALYKRTDNSETAWASMEAVLDEGAGTLSSSSQRAEFMLGLTPVVPLPPAVGSGNAVSFDGVSDFLSAPHSTHIDFGPMQNFSIEMWLKIPSTPQVDAGTAYHLILEKGSLHNLQPSYGVFYSTEGGQKFVALMRFNNGAMATTTATSSVADNKFHHYVFQKDGANLKTYQDGVLVSTADDLNNVSTQNSNGLIFGAAGAGDFLSKFNGTLDEVKFWNIALTQAQIRDRMCHKITASDELFANLVAYYNFDEGDGLTSLDHSNTANNGTLSAGLARVISGAPLGDVSAHDYVNEIKTASISHTGGESFSVTSSSGNPDGIHVYRIDEKPNTLTGTSGVGSNNKYFGVFQVNGTTPAYSAVYNYNPASGTEANFRLFKRNNNSETSWQQITSDLPNTGSNSISVTGTSTEYILGSVGGSLPVNLLSFSAQQEGTTHQLRWNTTQESNTHYFEIQQSTDARTFTAIGQVQAVGEGNHDYSFTKEITEARSNYYYRLKMVDLDGSYAMSRMIRLFGGDTGKMRIFPNPFSRVVTIDGLKNAGAVKLIAPNGQVLQQRNVSGASLTMDLQNLHTGIYLLQHESVGGTVTWKLVKE